MIESIIRYFDLQSKTRTVLAGPHGAGGSYAPVIPQYLVVCAGVVVEPLLRHYIQAGVWELDYSAFIGRVVFGLIIGVVILPGVYKSAFDAEKPILIQLAALFPLGIGWQSLFTAATKIVI
ncbi:hypothetical protein AB9F35_21870 [Rhizobium leguminosarum]|uniref:hypothetical protein n=1 Tax=Rhizobium leguminosarum TaxID=384 RepID=UPI003F9DE172